MVLSIFDISVVRHNKNDLKIVTPIKHDILPEAYSQLSVQAPNGPWIQVLVQVLWYHLPLVWGGRQYSVVELSFHIRSGLADHSYKDE